MRFIRLQSDNSEKLVLTSLLTYAHVNDCMELYGHGKSVKSTESVRTGHVMSLEMLLP